jgi:hypothetical protein
MMPRSKSSKAKTGPTSRELYNGRGASPAILPEETGKRTTRSTWRAAAEQHIPSAGL